MELLGVGVGHILAKERPEQANVLQLQLPRRHRHENSSKQITPARVTISTPYPYMETKNSDIVLLCLSRQRQYLRRVAEWRNKDPGFMTDLRLLEEAEATEQDRLEAETRVKAMCREYGENISHGDLQTVAMFENAKLIMAGSVTAFGRLEFLGIMRLGLLHLKMRKVMADYTGVMPNESNYKDIGCLAWLVSVANKPTISNRPKDIKKDDSSFEHHDQVSWQDIFLSLCLPGDLACSKETSREPSWCAPRRPPGSLPGVLTGDIQGVFLAGCQETSREPSWRAPRRPPGSLPDMLQGVLQGVFPTVLSGDLQGVFPNVLSGDLQGVSLQYSQHAILSTF